MKELIHHVCVVCLVFLSYVRVYLRELKDGLDSALGKVKVSLIQSMGAWLKSRSDNPTAGRQLLVPNDGHLKLDSGGPKLSLKPNATLQTTTFLLDYFLR